MRLPPEPPPDIEQHDVPFILDHIGVDFSNFEGRVLDIGCGVEAWLVEHLRNFGIPAEGIDPVLEIKKTYLIRAFGYEPIQRPDNHYDLALSHMSNFRQGSYVFKGFLAQLSNLSEEERNLAQEITDKAMLECVKETKRVLKPGKELRIFPRPKYWLETYAQEIQREGIEVRTEKIPDEAQKRLAIVYFTFLNQFGSPTPDIFEEEFYHRAVLVKA